MIHGQAMKAMLHSQSVKSDEKGVAPKCAKIAVVH